MSDPFDGEDFDSVLPEVKKIEEAKAAKDSVKEDTLNELRKEPDIIKRAKSMEQHMRFRVFRSATSSVPNACDENMFMAFDTLFGRDPDAARPHLDEFRGALVDHNNEKIDKHYPIKPMLSALSYAGLKGFKAATVREGLQEYALTCKRNDLCIAIEKRMMEWDGKPRLDTYLWTLFRAFDTPFNRLISKYFWLSFYMRCMHPGSDAPIVISLIGDQMNGKSYFSKRLVQITTGNPESDSVKLDLREDNKTFMRKITGNSNIATIPEMRGYAAADHNKTKDFITLTADNFDQKYGANLLQQRQWIIMMDSNKYEGILRDDTGNRRFAPMFVAQLPDVDNKPAWEVKHAAEDGIKFNAGPFIASKQFELDVLQLFAEARAWYVEHGSDAYSTLVDNAATAVQHFSDKEMKRGSGTIVDFDIENYMDFGIESLDLGSPIDMRKEGHGKSVFVCTANLERAMDEIAGKQLRISPYRLRDALIARGGVARKRTNTKRVNGEVVYGGPPQIGYVFPGIATKGDLMEMLARRVMGDIEPEDDVENGETEYLPKGDGPF